MKFFKSIIVIFFLGFLVACSANVDGENSNGKGEIISLFATDSSSSYYGYNVGIANAISTLNPEIQVSVVETGGSSDNMQRLSKGEGKMALGTSPSDYQTYFGEGDFKDIKNENIRALWYFVPSPFNFIVSDSANVNSFEDLNGKDFSFGGSGTSTEKVTTAVFETIGIQPKSYAGSMSDAQAAFADRRIVGLTKTGTPPDSYVQKTAAEQKIKLLGLTEDQIKSITEKLPYIGTNTIPAGSYEGVDEDISTVQFTMSILLDSSVSQETGYKMWKAMWSEEGKKIWLNSFSAAADVDIPELTLGSAIPLHAGAVQFLKENGYEVPDEIIPPEYKEVN
ncbi:TAXI family TRAP transporter solute-binding subunit [Bacillus sp. ISL-47]|uniref:TAXI family TRAP transporter solute-binding subunit n=1 Tax=Bacillus sp. ISL-47 TaxID=2819130 RepID=UPI001BE69217|nr:TAXI family TRAP transporter solute-binding subunit [Bacillus sp. ISL-47]MBT2689834.1 TAXI family TRAP transporter solute-binding subunit [Bacillus sp. ISL-47]MBT2710211.1 TAXI family TRAP transporter solute-binding subunit [Pseudomonas sp. ISL-84]